jgi:hypothetical protein
VEARKQLFVTDEIEIKIRNSGSDVFGKVSEILKNKWPEITTLYRPIFDKNKTFPFLKLASKPILVKNEITIKYKLLHLVRGDT